VALIAEQASSLNEKRKGMKKLLTLIDLQAIDVVLIAYPDRLVRLGCGSLEEAFR
jgi:putative resolvase